jgi:DNA topoisomerase-1
MAATTDPTHRRTDDIAQQAAPVAMPPGLRHADDTRPGYTRRREKREKDGFAYFDVSGKRIDDAREIARINALAIPPAYKDVWICPDARGHFAGHRP